MEERRERGFTPELMYSQAEKFTETLDVVPRQWFVTEHVREKFSCRSCETITQPPAPFHAIARGFAGPSLLAMMLVEKYANHQAAQSAEPHGRFILREPCQQ
jgi:transposase